jgi:hypothetical protein
MAIEKDGENMANWLKKSIAQAQAKNTPVAVDAPPTPAEQRAENTAQMPAQTDANQQQQQPAQNQVPQPKNATEFLQANNNFKQLVEWIGKAEKVSAHIGQAKGLLNNALLELVQKKNLDKKIADEIMKSVNTNTPT